MISVICSSKKISVKKLELLHGGRRHQEISKATFDVVLVLRVVHSNEQEHEKAKKAAEKNRELLAIRQDETEKLANFLPHLREETKQLRQSLHDDNIVPW